MIGSMSLLLLLASVGMVVTVDLGVEMGDSFPFPANSTFSMRIVAKLPGAVVSTNNADTLVVILRDGDDKELQKAIIDFGYKEQNDEIQRGDWMTMQSWKRDEAKTAVSVSLVFTLKAHMQWLEVLLLEATTMARRRAMIEDLNLAKSLLRVQVSLRVPPRLELSLASEDGRVDELTVGGRATAICRSLDGIPPASPTFLDLEGLAVTRDDSGEEAGVPLRTLQFSVTILDHRRRLTCQAGEVKAARTILVLHHPTAVSVRPEPGPLLFNGSQLLCAPADGYPVPTARWVLVSGPPNAARYINLTAAPARLQLAPDAPVDSRWSLNCSSSNTIPGSVAVFNRTVTFTVGRESSRPPPPTFIDPSSGSGEGLLAGLNLTYQIVVGFVVVVAIVLFCLMIVIILCLARRCCTERGPPAARRNNGLPQTKAPVADKDMDQDQMVLLISANKEDQGPNDGLTSAPHECDGLPQDQIQDPIMTTDDQDGDPSVGSSNLTMAETNVSSVPSKEDPLPPISPCDNQVVFSQVNGTVSNPPLTEEVEEV